MGKKRGRGDERAGRNSRQLPATPPYYAPRPPTCHNIIRAEHASTGAPSLHEPRKQPDAPVVLRSARSVSDGRAQRTQAPATAGLFITSPGFAEDGGSNSSPKQPSLSDLRVIHS